MDNQVPLNALIKDMEKLKKSILTKGCFALGHEGEIGSNRFFKVSNELSNFIDKTIDE